MITVDKENKTQYQVSAAFLFMIILSLTLSLIVYGILTVIGLKSSLVAVCLSSTCSPIAIVIVLALLSKRDKKNYITLKTGKGFNAATVILPLILFSGTFLGFGFINYLCADLFLKIGLKVSSPEIAIITFPQFILATVCLCAFPAIAEELFFRHFFLTNLKDLPFIAVILINGLIFALYHRSLSQLVYQFIFGVNLAVLYLKTENVLPCVIAHFLNNFTVVTFLYAGFSLNFFSAVIIAVGLLLLFAFYFIVFYTGKNKAFYKRDNPAEFSSYFMLFGITAVAICVLYIVLGAVGV